MSRVAVVTGGGSGMGEATCHELARRGHRVAVMDINGQAAPGYTPKVLEPDLQLLLDEYRDRGDRRVLILGRLEFNAIP